MDKNFPFSLTEKNRREIKLFLSEFFISPSVLKNLFKQLEADTGKITDTDFSWIFSVVGYVFAPVLPDFVSVSYRAIPNFGAEMKNLISQNMYLPESATAISLAFSHLKTTNENGMVILPFAVKDRKGYISILCEEKYISVEAFPLSSEVREYAGEKALCSVLPPE